VKRCSPHVPNKGVDIGIDETDVVLAMVHHAVPLRRLMEIRLKFHADHLVPEALFRNIDRYDTTTGTDIQQPFMLFQDHEGGEQDRVDGEPVSPIFLNDPQFFVAEDVERLVFSDGVTHTCRTQDPSGSWDRRTSIWGAYQDRSRRCPALHLPSWEGGRMPDRWRRSSRNRRTTHGPP